jgi:hypothetical protein
MKRRLRSIGWACIAMALALPLVLACSASDRSGSATDAGGHAITDAGAFGDAPTLGAPDAGAEADRSDPGAYAAACLDGMDQNAGGGVDCSDPSCGEARSCCVGSSDARCCTTPIATVDLHFVCAAAPCDTLAGLTTFGDVGPVQTTDGAFAPESDHGADSGAILPTDLDPRASIVSITASLGVPAVTNETDAVGVGLVAGGPSAHVVPLAAIVVSAARGQVLLLVGESVAGAAPAPTDGLLHDYTLSVDPSGHVSATGDGVSLSASVPLPSAPVRAAFFGRATNPGSLPSALPARIGALRVDATACDQPAALTRIGPITIIDHTGAALLDTATDPSLASDGTTAVLAFSAGAMGTGARSIFVASREADDAFHVRAPATGSQPVLAPPAGEAFESPALAYAGGVWTLYATRVRAGARSLVVATSSSGGAAELGAPIDITIPDLIGDLSSPAPVQGDPTHLVARFVGASAADADVAPGTAELVLLALDVAGASAAPLAGLCGADSSCAGGARSQAHLYAARTATISFDADEVNDPAVVFYDHVYRLYYAGRLGSRWSIGMLIAADLGYWRPASEGAPILAADGNGFDAVSVRGPAPLVENGQLSLYYVGSDGDAQAIALAAGGPVSP